MLKKRHDFKFEAENIRELDYLMPRLKYAVNLSKVIRWLENFEEEDLPKALQILSVIEYIDFNELNYRMDEQLKIALKSIPASHIIVIYPSVATYPKSTELINYILKDNPQLKKYNTRKKKRIIVTRDLTKDVNFTLPTSIILTDDFIGSGLSFKKGYDTQSDLKKTLDFHGVKRRFLISAICMREGEAFIKGKYPEIEIRSTFRDKLFDPSASVFNVTNNLASMQSFAKRYGMNLFKDSFFPFKSHHFGFAKSESLVAFAHTTPNNTLPIIWASAKWYPLFPRYAKDKISQAKEIKKEVAYYLGIMNRLGLDLYENKMVVYKGKIARKLLYNSLEDHALVTVLKLQYDGRPKPIICQLLGITLEEYADITKKGISKGLMDSSGAINSAGRDFFRNLMKNIRSRKFLKKEKENFEMKFVNYVPRSFMGKR